MYRFAPAPLDVDAVLNTEWLSRALTGTGDPVVVTGFEELERLGPSALKIRLRLSLAQGAERVPEQICIKGVFDPALKTWLTTGAQQAEALFYRDVAPRLSVTVPRSFYQGYDPETGAGHVIMEDLVPQGVRFLSATSPYAPEQARGSLDQLARLHGGTWRMDEPWVTPKLALFAKGPVMPPEKLTELMRGERGDALPDAIRDGGRILGAVAALAEREERIGRCFIHGDCHGGNVYEHADGIGLIDWQVLQRGHWSIDVAYHIAAALDVEARRASERDLLAYYLERLAVHGGDVVPFDTAWEWYRQAVPYGMMMWGITVRVEPAIVNRFVTRLGTAVADHQSFDMLGV
jgi:hypothetical protein